MFKHITLYASCFFIHFSNISPFDSHKIPCDECYVFSHFAEEDAEKPASLSNLSKIMQLNCRFRFALGPSGSLIRIPKCYLPHIQVKLLYLFVGVYFCCWVLRKSFILGILMTPFLVIGTAMQLVILGQMKSPIFKLVNDKVCSFILHSTF